MLSLQVISAFLIVTIVFIPIGVASLIASHDVCLSAVLSEFWLPVLYIINSADLNFLFIIYLSINQVVEIIDRYDSHCIPSNVTDKVAYIQTPGEKQCNRQLTVSFLDTDFSFWCLTIIFSVNSVPIIDELWISNFDNSLFS